MSLGAKVKLSIHVQVMESACCTCKVQLPTIDLPSGGNPYLDPIHRGSSTGPRFPCPFFLLQEIISDKNA